MSKGGGGRMSWPAALLVALLALSCRVAGAGGWPVLRGGGAPAAAGGGAQLGPTHDAAAHPAAPSSGGRLDALGGLSGGSRALLVSPAEAAAARRALLQAGAAEARARGLSGGSGALLVPGAGAPAARRALLARTGGGAAVTCASNQYVSADGLSCIDCTPQPGCTASGSGTTCSGTQLVCSACDPMLGYYLSKTSCLKCDAPQRSCVTSGAHCVPGAGNLLQCTTCAAGHFPDASGVCQACTAQAGCTAKGSGTTCLAAPADTSKLVCTDCDESLGFYLNYGGLCSVCTGAPANCAVADASVCAATGSTRRCVTCAAGYYLNADGLCTRCTTPQAGCTTPDTTRCSGTFQACTDCDAAAGLYAAASGACTACTAQTGCSKSGAACVDDGAAGDTGMMEKFLTCTACGSSYTLTDGACYYSACAAGQYYDKGTRSCLDCAPQSVALCAVSNPLACVMGVTPGVEVCTTCQPGAYSDYGMCRDCAPQADCVASLPTAQCVQLPTGEYREACSACAAGHALVNGVCVTCAAQAGCVASGATCLAAPADVTKLTCSDCDESAGFYLAGQVCTACTAAPPNCALPVAKECAATGTTRRCATCAAGYYVNADGLCAQCTATQAGCKAGFSITTQCAGDKQACSDCDEAAGLYAAPSGTCTMCTPQAGCAVWSTACLADLDAGDTGALEPFHVCTTCAPGYLLDPANPGVCKSVCDPVDGKYTLAKGGCGTCVTAQRSCVTSSAQCVPGAGDLLACTTCTAGHYPDPATGVCTACTDQAGCVARASGTTCLAAPDDVSKFTCTDCDESLGVYLTATGACATCTAAPLNCATSSTACAADGSGTRLCLACKDGYYLTAAGACAACTTPQTGCLVSVPGKCSGTFLACSDCDAAAGLYAAASGACTACVAQDGCAAGASTTACVNDTAIGDTGPNESFLVCTACRSGFALDAATETCYNNQCPQGQYYVKATKSCAACTAQPGCVASDTTSCVAGTTHLVCLDCNESLGYYDDFGTCRLCPQQANCLDSLGVCTLFSGGWALKCNTGGCASGYYLDDAGECKLKMVYNG